MNTQKNLHDIYNEAARLTKVHIPQEIMLLEALAALKELRILVEKAQESGLLTIDNIRGDGIVSRDFDLHSITGRLIDHCKILMADGFQTDYHALAKHIQNQAVIHE